MAKDSDGPQVEFKGFQLNVQTSHVFFFSHLAHARMPHPLAAAAASAGGNGSGTGHE